MANSLFKNIGTFAVVLGMLLAFAMGYGINTNRISNVEAMASETKIDLKVESNRSKKVDSEREPQMVMIQKDIAYLKSGQEDVIAKIDKMDDKFDNLKDLIIKMHNSK